MARQLRVEYPGAPFHLTARGYDQQTIVHDETDQTDFLTGLGQEVLPQRWRSAKSSNAPISFSFPSWFLCRFCNKKANRRDA
jgi:hypothetical protein